MKRIKRFAILSVLFALCCVFAFSSINLSSVKVNATETEIQDVENNETYTYAEEGYGEAILILYNDFTFKINVIFETGEELSGKGTYILINENVIALNVDGELLKVSLNKETMTFAEYIEIEEEIEEPIFEEEKMQELTDWIVALIVSFLGSGAFYGIFRAILNGTIKTLKAKLVELEEKNKISSDSKLAYEEKINNLEYKLDEYLGQNQVLLDYIQSKIKIDEEKVKKTNELLEHLMPKQTEEGE